MNSFGDHYKDVTKMIEFDEAKSNFISVSRSGLDTELCWINNKKIGTCELIKKELLPMAREGLQKVKIKKDDIDKFLGVIEERNQTRQNGTSWLLNSYSKLMKVTTREEATVALTAAMVDNQKVGDPVHKWKLADLNALSKWEPTSLLVEEFMTTDLFTVHKDDIPELVADVMDWQKIRYTPIEDDKGNLIGLISSRILLRHFSKVQKDTKKKTTVKDLMITNPLTVSPEASITEAMAVMKKEKVGCLPVVKNNKLVGIITEENFLNITSSLMGSLSKN